jgi:hypothetical protein
VRTFLTTERMSPELRARVERAVSQGTRARQSARRLGLARTFAAERRIGLARVLPVLVALVVAGLAGAGYVYDRREVEAERSAILAALDARRAALPPRSAGLLAAVEPLVAEAAHPDASPDVLDPALRGALEVALGRPALYVRGAAADLADPKRLALAARASDKDAFLVCLLHPPASTSERDLLDRVRGVYFAGAKVEDATASVRRLAEARVALAFTAPPFEASVRAANDFAALHRLQKELDAAPVELAKKAAAAELLLVVADLPPDLARVSLVDLASGAVLLRVSRKGREPSKTAAAAMYRAELEACELAHATRRFADGG